MYRRLYAYLEKLDFFYPLQLGCRGKDSTSHTLISMTEELETQLIMEIMGVELSLISKKHLIQ